MNISGNRLLNLLLDLFIILTAAIIVYIFLIGGIEIQVGNTVMALGKAKLACNKLGRPFFIFLILLLFKIFIRKPAPLRRLAHWLNKHRRTILLGVVVTVTAGIPRLWQLDRHSLTPDELTWIGSAQDLIGHLRTHEFKQATTIWDHPGIAPAVIIGASYTYLGKDTAPWSNDLLEPIIAARLPIALIGIATCLFLYLFARLHFGNATAFWGAIFLALLPEHIDSSRSAQLDSALTFFFTLCLLSYSVYTLRHIIGWKIASAIFFGLALLTKTPAYLLPIIIISWKMVARLRDRRGSLILWEASDLLWFGVGLGVYFSLYSRLWYEPQQLQLRWFRYASAAPTARLIAAINMITGLPWIIVMAGAVFACVLTLIIRRFATARGRWQGGHQLLRLILLVLFIGAFVQLFHKALINEMLHLSAVRRAGEAGHLKYWMGRVVICPPHWFYLFMLFTFTPPLILFLVICGAVRSSGAIFSREKGWCFSLLCIIAPSFYIIFMSMGHKMAIRYIDTAMPFICLLGGVGLTGISEELRRLGLWGSVPHAASVFQLLGIFLVVGSLLLPLRAVAPDYGIYCNFIIGGPQGAASRITIGTYTGTKESVEYLKSEAQPGDSIFVVGAGGVFRYYWEHDEPRNVPAVRIDQVGASESDWLMVPLGHRMRGLANKELRSTPHRRKVYSFTKCGVEWIDVYHLDKNR